MSVVSAVSVSPTCAVPLMVGVPVAGVLGGGGVLGPGTTNRGPPDSILPSPVQMAPSAGQSVVAFRSMATSAPGPGVTVDLSQRRFSPGFRRRT